MLCVCVCAFYTGNPFYFHRCPFVALPRSLARLPAALNYQYRSPDLTAAFKRAKDQQATKQQARVAPPVLRCQDPVPCKAKAFEGAHLRVPFWGCLSVCTFHCQRIECPFRKGGYRGVRWWFVEQSKLEHSATATAHTHTRASVVPDFFVVLTTSGSLTGVFLVANIKLLLLLFFSLIS